MLPTYADDPELCLQDRSSSAALLASAAVAELTRASRGIPYLTGRPTRFWVHPLPALVLEATPAAGHSFPAHFVTLLQVGALLGPELGSADTPSLEAWVEDLREAAVAAAQGLVTATGWLKQVSSA